MEGCMGGVRWSGVGFEGQMGMEVGRRGGSGREAGEQMRRVEKAWHVGVRECIRTAGTRAREVAARKPSCRGGRELVDDSNGMRGNELV